MANARYQSVQLGRASTRSCRSSRAELLLGEVRGDADGTAASRAYPAPGSRKPWPGAARSLNDRDLIPKAYSARVDHLQAHGEGRALLPECVGQRRHDLMVAF